MFSGAEYIADAVKGNIGDTNHMANVSSTIRGTRMEQIDWEVGEWDAFDFLYGTGMSMADSAAAMAIFGKAGGIALGLSAAAQSTNDALNRGMSKGQAFTSGLAAGIFEGLFESWSIGKFGNLTKNLKKADFRNLSKYIGKNMWNNAKEELLTEVANIAYDTAINGEFSQAETSIRQLMANGVSESDAKKQVAANLGLQIAEAAGSGALMGFGFGSAGAVSTAFKATAKSKENQSKAEKTGAFAQEDSLDIAAPLTNEQRSLLSTVSIETLNTVLGENAGNITLANLGVTDTAMQQSFVELGLADAEGNVNRQALMSEVKLRNNFTNIDGQTTTGYNNDTSINQDKGGNVNENASTNPQERGQSGYTGERTGLLQENLGGNDGQSRATWNEQREGTTVRSRESGKNRRITLEQSERLKNTAIKNEDGTPKTVYHFTDNIEFEVFAKGDIGFHFGNETQAAARGSIQKKKGRTITAHLNIKNPLYISTDIMSWRPRNLALKLYCDGLISEDAFDKISSLDNSEYFDYDSPASIELRRILSEKGYDGIVYQNMFEGDGESYIAFYPEQVIIIDDGRGGGADATTSSESTSAAESSSTNSQSTGTDSESAPTGGRVLEMPAITVKQQNFVKKIGKALGRNVEFVNMEKFLKEHDVNTEKLKIYPDGAIDGEGNIYIWYNAEKPVQFLFKHELTHFGERSKYYKRFVEFVRGTKIYEKWMREKVKTSESYKEWLKKNPQEVGKELRITQVEGFLKQDHINAQSKIKENFGQDDALAEVIADFVGENCFGESLKGLEALIDEANLKQHPKAIQYLIDFFAYLKKKLSGNKQITFELSRIEDSFRRLIFDANNTKTSGTKDGGMKYSIATDSDGEFVRIDTNQEIFDGKSTREMQDIARKLIRDNFRGKVLYVGEDGKAFISKRSSDEYAYPANRRMENGLKESKMRAAPELDNLLSVSEFLEHQNDDGRHPQATGGWDVYSTRFEVCGTMFSGEIKIMVTDRGYLFHDITKIKRLPVNGGLTENNSAAASGNPSIDSITDNGTPVNSNSMQKSENYSYEKNGLKFSVPTATENETDADTQRTDFTAGAVEKYTESQYNNFGWVRANDVLSAKEYNTLLSRFADYKHNKHKYPVTRFGEAVIHSSECPDVIMYVKGGIGSPQITKIVRIDYFDTAEIKEEIASNERRHLPQPYKSIENFYGQEIFTVCKARDYASFWDYQAEQEGRSREENDSTGRAEQDRGRSFTEGEGIDNRDGKVSSLKFSIATGESSDTSTDFTTEFKELMQSFQNGEISQDEYMQRMSELYQRSIEENGQIKPGEKVSAENKDFPVPKSVKDGTKVRQHTRRILESGRATEEQESFFKEIILAGKLSYTPTSNKKNIKNAEKAIEKEGYEKARENWSKNIANWAADANTVAKGEALLQLAFEQKNTVDIVNIAAQLAELGTYIGQGLQAMSLVKRMGGLGQLVYLERCVARINDSLKKRIEKGKAETVTIDPTLAQQLAESKTEAEFEITYAAIVKDIAAQVPSTFADKWNALRYVCMLFNPVTHIRNMTGNGVFFPGVRVKNVLAAVMEKGVSKEERTKVVKVKKAYQEFAEKDFAEVKDIITGTGKYNPSDEIRHNQRIFKSKLLEAARKFNFDMLEKEDVLFLKMHYKHALGGYLQAQGVDLSNISIQQLTKAREYAMQEALKATYRDASKAANMISHFAKTNAFTEIIVEGLIPYKKTPINIIKRGVEYSPIGLIKTLSKGIYDLNQGNISTTQFIDGLACGLTGTGVCILGMFLASLGIVKGGFDDEEKWFRKLNGEQEYSIQIGNFSYTIDWATPASIPLFLGVAIAEYDAEEDEDILSSIWNFGTASFEPLLNLSLLSGLEDAIAAVSYADDGEKITSFLGTTMESYFAQFLPTVFGKTANLFDDTRRTNYIDRTSNVPVVIQEAWNKIAGKIPIASQTRAEYVDAWGETQYTGNFIQRFFQQFVSPGYASTVNVTDVSDELMRLYRQTGVSGIFPSTPQKYLKIRGVRRDLSKEEYFDYATFKGQTQADLVNEAIHSKEYTKLTDEQKTEVIKDIYSYAGALAKCQLDYSYEEIASMEGEDKKGNLILTKEKYNRLNDKARQMLIDEYFMESSGNVKAYKTAKNGKSVVEYFCKKVKE